MLWHHVQDLEQIKMRCELQRTLPPLWSCQEQATGTLSWTGYVHCLWVYSSVSGPDISIVPKFSCDQQLHPFIFTHCPFRAHCVVSWVFLWNLHGSLNDLQTLALYESESKQCGVACQSLIQVWALPKILDQGYMYIGMLEWLNLGISFP